MSQEVVLILFQVVVLVFAFSVHESAHAYTAMRLGDPTAYMLGRVTLNPIKHLDLFGSVLLPLIGLFTGGWLIGWAKPCPITPRNFRDIRRGELLTALAGPARFRLGSGADAGPRRRVPQPDGRPKPCGAPDRSRPRTARPAG